MTDTPAHTPLPWFDWRRLLPPYWHQQGKTDLGWDAALNAALDKGVITKIGPHTAKVGPFEVWTANWPYAYGQLYDTEIMPTVKTRKRLRAAIIQARLAAALSQAGGAGE